MRCKDAGSLNSSAIGAIEDDAARRPGRLGGSRLHFDSSSKAEPLRGEHLQDFIAGYAAREESEHFRRFSYEELVARDKVSLDITWLRDESLEDMENLPPPDVIAQEIVGNLEAALAEFAEVAASLREGTPED